VWAWRERIDELPPPDANTAIQDGRLNLNCICSTSSSGQLGLISNKSLLSAMIGGLLVAAQLSSLYPVAQVTSVPLQTLRRNTPLPPRRTESDPPAEHALFSTVLHTPTTGTILMRVIHGGLIVELISLSSDVPPVRFVFPATILSSPAIFLWESHEIHIIAVTSVGSLYRLVLPGSAGKLWHDQVTKNWCREYLIQHTRGDVEGVVHVQGTHTVAIGMINGAILRLETEYLGDENNNGAQARMKYAN
jgi:nuclear pore complex protein Nup160